MRIKWNRHLDGSSSRREEEGTESQETEVKKRGPSSSPSIFRIFRRKKSRKRGEDETKADGGNGVVPPSEADEDDCASISSIATCASQPSSEVFHRDRASSLFSSFRLSLPGSKRKKRRIAPTPSETLLNGQEDETQVERYSTPDLRKPSEKLELPNSTQVSLSTSSPSIRHPPKGSSTSAQSLVVQNADILKWTNTRGATSSTSKLSKSVSFSENGSTDSSHSKCDNKALRTVDSVAMVEEDTEALESELPVCMSDNPRKSPGNKVTSSDDSLSSSSANTSNLYKQPGGEAASTVSMTKTVDMSKRSSEIIEDSSISDISHILDDLASEIRCYEKSNDADKISCTSLSQQGSLVTSSVNCSYRNSYDNESLRDRVLADEKDNKRYPVHLNLKNSRAQCIETGSGESYLPSENAHRESPLLCSERKEIIAAEKPSLDKLSNTEVPYFNVLSPELSVLSTKGLSQSPLSDTDKNPINGVLHTNNLRTDDIISGVRCDSENISSHEKQPVITNNNHLLCHVKIYENEVQEKKSEDSKVIEKPVSRNCSGNVTFTNVLKTEINPQSNDNVLHEMKSEILDIPISASNNNPCVHNGILNFLVKCDPLVNDSSALNLSLENKYSYDQKVPEKEVPTHKYHNFQKDQEVPEFEQSLLEFEEVCNKYMSRSTPDFSDSSSIIPLNNNSTKTKSVLDFNFSFIYPNFQEKGEAEISSINSKRVDISPRYRELIKQNMESKSEPNLEYLCQNITEMSALPLPPKQWINCGGLIENESTRHVFTDGEQCTTARGKNLCQEPCLGALPTTVMLHDSDLEGIDTPQQSSTLQPLMNKSGREHISIVAAEKEQLSDDRPPPNDMISSVGITISSLSEVLDYSYTPKPSREASVYFDSEIRETYRGPRAICDPLVYSTEATKGLESLGAENYLNGHNFCDIRNVGLCEVINDVSCDYVQGGNSLIEISNPYEEESFILSQDFHRRNLVNAPLPSDSLRNSEADVCDTISGLGHIRKTSAFGHNSEIFGNKINSTIDNNENPSENEKPAAINSMLVNSTTSGDSKLSESAVNGHDVINEILSHSEQKNIINKTKSSMIPCRKKGPNIESKRIETKLKSKKSNSFPRFMKSESYLPVKSDSSHRVLSKSYKDSDVGQVPGKRIDSSSNKPNGNHSVISPVNLCESAVTIENNNELNSQRKDVPSGKSLEGTAVDGNKTSSLCSSYVLFHADSTGDNNDDLDNVCESGSIALDTNGFLAQKNEIDVSDRVHSPASTDSVPFREPSMRDLEDEIAFSSKGVQNSDARPAEYRSPVNEIDDIKFDEFCLQSSHSSQQDLVPPENIKCENCLKLSECFQHSQRRSSLPAVGMRKTSITSSKESLNSQLTSTSNRGKSRIPKKQSGPRGAQPTTKGPVRPPMWLSKAELTQEIQRLGTLCEARTKELNRLKMETKHVSVGFDAFAALLKYMVEDLNALSVPALSEDLGKTLKQLELTKQDLAYYEREVEEMKSHHCQELNDLSNKLFEVYQSEVAELNAKHQEEINHLKSDHQKQMEHLKTTYDATSAESKAHHDKMIKSLEQEIINQREELQLFQEREIKDLEEKHVESSKLLQEHIEQLQKKCAELKQHSMSMEDAMRKDTDSKLQWVSAAKLDLEKEVESLKTVLEMKNKELHTLRVQNLEMEKQLEELPFAREKIKMLQARAEDLEALMTEKTKLERQLSTENQQIKDTYEKESKVNRRLSMENEELLWRLRQAENSLITGSFSEVPEFPEVEENAATSPTKSPGPQMMSRSVFFTFVDKEESSSHSPRSQYKKIMPGFSANYKTSPAKSSKSPPAPSPRRAKSHSEPPQPLAMTSTPRKIAKQALNKTKGSQKRQRSGSDSGRPAEHAEVGFSSVTESMASSVSSESSVFEHRERLLEEHKEHIIHSLEILREQRSTESSVDETIVMEKKWCSDDIKITGELSHLESEDMSRSAEFSDPKTYYHMTFPVLKESGIPDCDMEDGCKNSSSSSSSPLKEIATMHSMSENNIKSAVESSDTLRVMSASSHAAVSAIVERVENKRNSCSEATISTENVQREAANSDKTDNRWRTI